MDNHSFCRSMVSTLRKEAKKLGVAVPKNITALRQTSRQFFIEADGIKGVTIEGDCAADAKANYISSLIEATGTKVVVIDELEKSLDSLHTVVEAAKSYDTTSNLIAYEQGELDESDVVELFQNLINTGMAWKLQGSVGRQAMSLIESGDCVLGEVGHKDYWGNYIPSRYEVKPGTKGSVEYSNKMKGGK